jgi:hypothetical protein
VRAALRTLVRLDGWPTVAYSDARISLAVDLLISRSTHEAAVIETFRRPRLAACGQWQGGYPSPRCCSMLPHDSTPSRADVVMDRAAVLVTAEPLFLQ